VIGRSICQLKSQKLPTKHYMQNQSVNRSCYVCCHTWHPRMATSKGCWLVSIFTFQPQIDSLEREKMFFLVILQILQESISSLKYSLCGSATLWIAEDIQRLLVNCEILIFVFFRVYFQMTSYNDMALSIFLCFGDAWMGLSLHSDGASLASLKHCQWVQLTWCIKRQTRYSSSAFKRTESCLKTRTHLSF